MSFQVGQWLKPPFAIYSAPTNKSFNIQTSDVLLSKDKSNINTTQIHIRNTRSMESKDVSLSPTKYDFQEDDIKT